MTLAAARRYSENMNPDQKNPNEYKFNDGQKIRMKSENRKGLSVPDLLKLALHHVTKTNRTSDSAQESSDLRFVKSHIRSAISFYDQGIKDRTIEI